MKQLFQDIHIDSIMTFLRQINLFKKNLIAFYLKNSVFFIFVLAYNALFIIASLWSFIAMFCSVKEHVQLSGIALWNCQILHMIFPVNNRTATRCHFSIHYYHPFYLLQIFTFSNQIMFSLIPSDANDPQGLMRRLAPKQTNKM